MRFNAERRTPNAEHLPMIHRLWLLGFLIGLVALVFVIRLAHLQLVQGERLAQAVDQSRLTVEVIPPRRGRITDRHDTPIVDNRAVYHLAVVLADLELSGRSRRELPCWRLDQARFDALVADLAVRLPRIPPGQVRDTVLREISLHPGTGMRLGPRQRDRNLALLLVPRTGLKPGGDGDADTEQLVASDLLSASPREALERELSGRWNLPITLCTEAEFRAATARIDKDFNLVDERSHPVLEPFLPPFRVRLPLERGALALELRLIEPERRAQAEQVLAGLINELPQLIHERFDRALAAARSLSPEPLAEIYFGASVQAEGIAPLLPPDQGLREIPITGVPGAHERILVLQGDAPESDGLFALLSRRLAASLGGDADWISASLRKHAERIRAITCDRDYRVHQVIFDPVRYERFVTKLAAALTRLGRPASRLDIEQALAQARRIADRAWMGQTHLDPIPLLRDISHDMAVRLSDTAATPPQELRKLYDDTEEPTPGLTIEVDLGREYAFPSSATHLIGTIARTSDPERGGAQTTWTGLSGLEQRYDALLRGMPGTVLRARTPDGVVVVNTRASEAGTDVRTELDMELQTVAEDSLTRFYELAEQLGTANAKMDKARAVGKGRAGFVLMDCQTGALLACASTPTYAMQDYTTHYKELLQAPGEPLRNWAAEAEMPPGSSMKICTALAGLEYGTLNPGERIHCLGYMQMINGKKILSDHAGEGDFDLSEAIRVSSNCYFATVAARLNRPDPNRLSEMAARFGLGQSVALDVPGQRPGILPSPAFYARQKRKWLPSDSWFLGIGQALTASPLQVACIAAAVANGGHILRPYLVKPAGQPEIKDLNIRKEWLDEVRRGMEMATDSEPGSTAKYMRLEGAAANIKVAAKTGTSEWGSASSRERGLTPDNAWMIGYAPADHPTVAFACFIHSGTFGGAATTGVAKRVLESYFTKYGRRGHVGAKGQRDSGETEAEGLRD